jgi:hypothetical protein
MHSKSLAWIEVCLITVCAVLRFATGLRAATAVEAWVQRYGGSASLGVGAIAMVADADGNIIVAGSQRRVDANLEFLNCAASHAACLLTPVPVVFPNGRVVLPSGEIFP